MMPIPKIKSEEVLAAVKAAEIRGSGL